MTRSAPDERRPAAAHPPSGRRARRRCPPGGGGSRVRSVRVEETIARIDDLWASDIVPALERFISIPNVSPAYDEDWAAHGHMAAAVELVTEWCRHRPIAGLTVDVHELPDRTPVVVCEIPAFGAGAADDTVILYGHLDKQPEMT